MAPQFLQAKVTSNQLISAHIHQIICQIDSPLNFIPGQYLIVKIHDTRISQYSLASLPNGDSFQLLVDVSPGGDSSQYFQSLQAGDTLEYLPPQGNFIFRQDDQATNLLFLATGSGLAPLICMIESLLLQGDTRSIYLLFGVRNQQDIFFQSKLSELASQSPQFNYLICLSDPESGWAGHTGHITHYINNLNLPWPTTAVYLCGAPSMIIESQEQLIKLGVPLTQIYFEKYW